MEMVAAGLEGERIAALEKENQICAQDRRDIWNAVNELRPVPMALDTLSTQLARIEKLVESKDQRIIDMEKREAVSNYQRNAIVGAAGFIAAGIGGVAAWVVKELVWPAIRKAFGWE
jgi:hypothetical protein